MALSRTPRVGNQEFGWAVLAAQHPELVPADEDLEVLGAAVSASAAEHSGQRAHDEEDEEEHRRRVDDRRSRAAQGPRAQGFRPHGLRLWTDVRLGGQPRYVLARDGDSLMQVPDEVRQCVVFLHAEEKGQRVAHGTAFFVALPFSEDPDRTHVYLVTARHVIDGIRTRSDDQKVYIRLNLRSGEAGWAGGDLTDWLGHPDESALVDIAVVPWAPPAQVVEYKALPLSMFATPETLAQNEIGLGDEVFMTGLFVGHSGRRRNIPIVRVGNIAAIPEEPVRTQLGLMPGTYLIEARSVGGISGSPVFVMVGPTRVIGGATALGQRQFFLLGAMHGHWQTRFEADEAATDAQTRYEYVNMGIAIVVSVEKILEVLEQPVLKKLREKVEKEVGAQGLPTMDAIEPEPDRSPDEPMIRGEFCGGLRRIKKEPRQAP